MKKVMNSILEQEELVEIMCILLDEDREGALTFLKKHFKGKTCELQGTAKK